MTSLAEFANNGQVSSGALMECQTPTMLRINLNAQQPLSWIKHGSMTAYTGRITLARQSVSEQGGIGKSLKKHLTGEGQTLTKAEGEGFILVADHKKTISLLHLNDEGISVNGNDILAIDGALKQEIHHHKGAGGILGGGLWNTFVSGTGFVAITTHGAPVTLVVTPGNPVRTDRHCTVAWSSNLKPDVKLEVSAKTFFGRGSGDSVQLEFALTEGSGFVTVQPYEELGPTQP
eukprot:TRINITY_DN78318_c0_g1_i1.p1 TRINITY_DN78318_c0_g1~~TRINITY_DN78318_c0_g1_i1.p1  ORF type:complete len:233 (+),score=29.51 TRINITY_DN78318_c0_g1_i1:85-783(+)